jgi:hypothetical protein
MMAIPIFGFSATSLGRGPSGFTVGDVALFAAEGRERFFALGGRRNPLKRLISAKGMAIITLT